MVSEINRKKRLVKKNNNEWVNFIWTNIKEHETSKWLEKKHKSNVKWRQSHRNSMKLNVRGEGGRTREFEEIEVEALRWLVLLWMLMCSSFSVSDLSFGFGPFLLCCVVPRHVFSSLAPFIFFFFFSFLIIFWNGLIILLMLILTVLYESTCRNVRYKLTEKNKMRINLC